MYKTHRGIHEQYGVPELFFYQAPSRFHVEK